MAQSPEASQQPDQPKLPKGFPPLSRKAYALVVVQQYIHTECVNNPETIKMLEEVKAMSTISVGEVVLTPDITTVQIFRPEDFAAMWLFTGSPIYARMVKNEAGDQIMEEMVLDDRDKIMYIMQRKVQVPPAQQGAPPSQAKRPQNPSVSQGLPQAPPKNQKPK